MSQRSVSQLDDFQTWARAHLGGGAGALVQRLVYAGPDAQYGIGLDASIPGYGIACVESASAVDILRAEGIDVHVLETSILQQLSSGELDKLGVDDPDADRRPARFRNTPALLESASFKSWMAGKRAADARAEGADASAGTPSLPSAILVFKTSHAIEQRCAQMGWKLLASPAKLTRRWENKVAFAKIAQSLDLPRPEGMNFDPSEAGYADLSRRFGPDLVIQAPHGYSGAKTWRVRSQENFDAIRSKLRGRHVRSSRYHAGLPVTLNACVTAHGIACSAPFLQVTGDPLLTPHRLGSCGNDWSSAAARIGDAAPFLALAERIGAGLAKDGFRGIFGVDFVLTEDMDVLVIEVNPRLVASIALFTQLELRAGRLPLLARHLMAFLDPGADRAALDHHHGPVDGAQVIVHNLEEGSRTVTGVMETGAYSLSEIGAYVAAREAGEDSKQPFETAGSAPSPRRASVRIDRRYDAEDCLALVPAQGERTTGGAAFGRIQLPGKATRPDGRLLPEIEATVRWMREDLRLSK